MYDSTSDTSYDNVDSSVNTAFKRAEQGTMELNDLLATAGALSKDESIQLYRLWLEHTTSPHAFVAFFNLGVALSSSNDYVAAEEVYRKALEFNPDLFQARLNLGSCLEQQSRVEEALEQWKVVANAINISKPENRSLQLHALNNLGRLLEITRQFQTAFEMLDKSFAIDPSQRDVLIHLVHLKQKICKWPIYTPPEGISNADMKKYTSPLAMLAISEDPALQLVSAKQFVEYKFPVTTTEILSPKYGYNHDKVRIGYLSSNLSMHAVSLLTVELFELHNRSQFEVYGFCWSREDGTAFRKRVISAMDHFITIGGMDDREAAETIRFHEIDVLVDLHGLTSGARPLILAYRPAPIQVTYLGFPGPTGLPWIDYVIADRYLIPENTAQYFTEKPLYLPNCFQSSDSKREVGLMPTRVDNGLPEKDFVFCSFNNNYKFTQEVFATWMRILKRVPGSVFWLLADNEWSKENLLTEAIKQGINKERLVFAPRVTPADYLARYQLADLFLDTFPFNGGTTANDALFMGLPLLTLSGRTFASRMAGSLLTNLGLPELIATDLKEYEEKAVRFAKNTSELKVLQSRLKENKASGSVFDIQKLTEDYEINISTVLRNLELKLAEVDSKGAAEENKRDSRWGLEQPDNLVTKVHYSKNIGTNEELLDPLLQAVTDQVFFSIIVPTHKRATLLRRALQSIKAQQSPVPFEVVVVSDVIDPATDTVCAELLNNQDMSIRRNGPPGPSASRNLGLSLVKGRYVLFLDDDDAWHPGMLEQLYASTLVRQGQPVYFNCSVVKERRLPESPEFISETIMDLSGRLTNEVYIKNQVHMSCFAFPRDIIQGLTFDTYMRAYEDWEYLLSIFNRQMPTHVPILGSRVFEVDDSTTDRRGSSEGANGQHAILDYLYVYRRHPAPSELLKTQRSVMLKNFGLLITPEML